MVRPHTFGNAIDLDRKVRYTIIDTINHGDSFRINGQMSTMK